MNRKNEDLAAAGYRIVFNSSGTPASVIDEHGGTVFPVFRVALGADGLMDTLKDGNGNLLFDVRDYSAIITANTVAPLLSPGTAVTGDTLSCTTGTWSHNATSYTYQWYRGASPIGSAVNATYVCQVADEGATITCKVAATNRGGTATAVTSSNNVVPTAP